MKAAHLLSALITIVALFGASDAQTVEQIVKWTATVPDNQTVQPGQQFGAVLSAEIEQGWHVYAITQEPGGPIALTVTVPADQPFKMAGKATGDKPVRKFDPNFEMETDYYEKSVKLRVSLLADQNVTAGQQKVRINVRFQTCNEERCLPPKTAQLDAAVTVTAAKPQSGTEGLGVGAQVPEFTFTDFDGRARKFSEFRGKYVLVDFWATWCKPCLADIPHLKELYEKYKDKGFEIIGMDSETLSADEETDPEFAKETGERARNIVKTRGASWTHATSETAVPVAIKVFKVESLPTKVLIDREGKVVARIKEGKELDEILARLLGGKQSN